jgi:hypothetical protein
VAVAEEEAPGAGTRPRSPQCRLRDLVKVTVVSRCRHATMGKHPPSARCRFVIGGLGPWSSGRETSCAAPWLRQRGVSAAAILAYARSDADPVPLECISRSGVRDWRVARRKNAWYAALVSWTASDSCALFLGVVGQGNLSPAFQIAHSPGRVILNIIIGRVHNNLACFALFVRLSVRVCHFALRV